MENKEISTKEYYTIDVLHIVKSLWKRIWIIAISGLLIAVIGFTVSAFLIAPKYSSHVKLYVNSSSFSFEGSFNISVSQIDAAKRLVRTYGEILNSRTTLERVIDEAEVDYTWKELSKMIECAPSNETEIMKVTVTCENPYEASRIANTIAEILPVRISEIIEGASMEVVDSAIPDNEKVSPSILKYTAIGFILGVLASCAVFVVLAILDDTIHDEEYILRTYDFPILGKVPNLLEGNGKSYGYYSQRRPTSDN